MPLSKNTEKCFKQWKKEHPHGRSKKKMSKKAARKQAIAVCAYRENYLPQLKNVINGMTFSKFLLVESTYPTTKEFIRALPSFQEMMADQSIRPKALDLAKQLIDIIGDGPIGDAEQDYVIDEFDDLSRQVFKAGTMIGDWKGEQEYQDWLSAQQKLDKAASEWEVTTGMNAETGEDLPKKRLLGARHTHRTFSNAKRSMDAERKAAELEPRSFDERTPGEQAAAVAVARKLTKPYQVKPIIRAAAWFKKLSSQQQEDIISKVGTEINSRAEARAYAQSKGYEK